MMCSLSYVSHCDLVWQVINMSMADIKPWVSHRAPDLSNLQALRVNYIHLRKLTACKKARFVLLDGVGIGGRREETNLGSLSSCGVRSLGPALLFQQAELAYSSGCLCRNSLCSYRSNSKDTLIGCVYLVHYATPRKTNTSSWASSENRDQALRSLSASQQGCSA